jgi:hypothetical protein
MYNFNPLFRASTAREDGSYSDNDDVVDSNAGRKSSRSRVRSEYYKRPAKSACLTLLSFHILICIIKYQPCLSVSLSVYLSVCLPVFLFAFSSVNLPNINLYHKSLTMSVCLSLMSVCPAVFHILI